MKCTNQMPWLTLLLVAALAGCKGEGTLLDVYPMEPIVNPEVRALIKDNRIVHARLASRNQIIGITEKGGFATADRFKSFAFEPYTWPGGQGVMGFGNGIIVHATAEGASFVLRYSVDNGATWLRYGGTIIGEDDLRQGAVQVLKPVIGVGRLIWLLCQQDIGQGGRALVYRVDLESRSAMLCWSKADAVASDIDFSDAETGWLLCADRAGRAGDARMLKTTDGGLTWAEVAVLEGLTDPSIAVVDANQLLVYDRAGYAFHSADGGLSYTPVTIGEGMACQAVSAQTVYALLADGLAKSTDGGRTWLTLHAEASGVYVTGNAMHFYSERQGIVYGSDRLFVTDDGGENWEVLVYPYDYVFE